MTVTEIRDLAEALGLDVETESLGDGNRRYRFYLEDRVIGRALGAGEAEAWLRGFEAALEVGAV